MGAKVHAQHAREQATKTAREADAAECLLWSEQMEGFGGPAQPSPTLAQCLNGGYGWLEVMCKRCEIRASLPLDAIRRPRDTPIWKLESAFRCRSCGTLRYRAPVHMIRLTKEQMIAPTPLLAEILQRDLDALVVHALELSLELFPTLGAA
jgi:hypothetical protein